MLEQNRVKYPRTRHFSISRSKTNDDKIATSDEVNSALSGRLVVMTEKMDGENTSIYANGYSHARSIDSKFHQSRSVIKELAANVSWQMQDNLRLSGENMFARHSIVYDDLEAYFLLFGAWEDDSLLSWSGTESLAVELGLKTVPVIWTGSWVSEEDALAKWNTYKSELSRESEGFVVRSVEKIAFNDFTNQVFKFVREKHVQTSDHWMHSQMITNLLKELS